MMIKLMIGLLIIACIAPLFIKGPDGRPIMTLDDWKVDFSVDEITKQMPDTGDAEQPQLPVYRWQDENGQWHFSDTPPDAAAAEEVEIGAVNLMEAYVPPPESGADGATVAPATGSPSPVVSTSQVQEMMETVNDLQEALDERQADIDAATRR